MGHVVLFHSVLGVRPGVMDAAERLRGAGHEVEVVDQYDGRVFDDYDEASAWVEGIAFPALMEKALAAVEPLPDGFVAVGFSNGAGMAEYVATQRQVGGVVMAFGALPMQMLGAAEWPAGVPAQMHHTHGDPVRRQDWIDAVAHAVTAAGAPLGIFEYPGEGHLFTDPSLPGEYDRQAAETLWSRVLAFCANPARRAAASHGRG
jgi:dienelactone hydrolase